MNAIAKYLRWWPVVAAAAAVLMLYEWRLENQFFGALTNERQADEAAWKAQRSHLVKSAQQLAVRVRISDSLAKARDKIAVQLLNSRPAINPATSSGKRNGNEAPPVAAQIIDASKDTAETKRDTARVVINDTSYVVPARVAEAVRDLTKELANADTLRMAADTTVRAIAAAVPAADSVIKIEKKKPPWILRVLGKATTVLCAAGGAGVGSLGGKGGAVIGAGVGATVCMIAR